MRVVLDFRRSVLTRFSFIMALALAAAGTPVAAQEKAFVGYYIKSKTQTVDGTMLVDGYTPKEVMGFVRADCASRQVGQMVYVGKTYRKRGHRFQKFRASCVGGPSQDVVSGTRLTVEVERMPDGRNMFEYTFARNGNIGYHREIR